MTKKEAARKIKEIMAEYAITPMEIVRATNRVARGETAGGLGPSPGIGEQRIAEQLTIAMDLKAKHDIKTSDLF